MSTPQHIDPELVLLVDKPLGWTSFGIVKKVRWAKKLKKVGHAGTLDPLATGLLILCTGKKTKEIDQYMGLPKEYTGTMVLGKVTPSHDLETEITEEKDIGHLTTNQIESTVAQFVGEIAQTPPQHSAVKIDGKRAYKSARAGETVKIEPRNVHIYQFEISIDLPNVHFKVNCSKGTYIRSLVRDFGDSLGVGAYMSALRRTKIGDFKVEDALQLDDIVKNNEDL